MNVLSKTDKTGKKLIENVFFSNNIRVFPDTIEDEIGAKKSDKTISNTTVE